MGASSDDTWDDAGAGGSSSVDSSVGGSSPDGAKNDAKGGEAGVAGSGGASGGGEPTDGGDAGSAGSSGSAGQGDDAGSDGSAGSGGAPTDAGPDGTAGSGGSPTDAAPDGTAGSGGALTDASSDGTAGSAGSSGAAGSSGSGGSAGSGGSSGTGGSAGAGTCSLVLKPKNDTCTACLQNQCLSECQTCAGNTECEALLNCIFNCSDDFCKKSCWDNHPNGQKALEALAGEKGCTESKCDGSCPDPPSSSNCSVSGVGRTGHSCFGIIVFGLAAFVASRRSRRAD